MKLLLALSLWLVTPAGPANSPVRIVSTLPDYASIAEYLGGEHVEVRSIALGYQDAHFVSAKPSFSRALSQADLFLTTGMDLELWAPVLIDSSRNRKIREGSDGYVSVSQGIAFLDIPSSISRAGGDIHIYGNPHIHTDPLRGIQIARNILTGLKRVDPVHADFYDERFEAFEQETYRRLFGAELVELVGGDQLGQLTMNHQLSRFLDANSINDRPLRSFLGGWLHEAECLKGKEIVAYHKNWIYFTDRFGIRIVDYVESKPGIPPGARHLGDLIQKIQIRGIRALLTANYYDEAAPKRLEAKVGIQSVIVPLSVGGTPEAHSYFDLFDIWIDGLRATQEDCR